jgi:hypothetical protein
LTVIGDPMLAFKSALRLEGKADFMLKLLNLAVLILSSASVLAQGAPALDVFTNPDGAFHFSYPENYELLSGERILKATQGRHSGLPVCDFSKSLVCVIYPIERLGNELEAAGFSVDVVSLVTSKSDCLGYADRFARSNDEHSQPAPFSIKGRTFQHVSAKRRMDGHAQSSDLYRTFQKDRCYELHIEVSLADESTAQPRGSSKSPEGAVAANARESLRLILSSVSFGE